MNAQIESRVWRAVFRWQGRRAVRIHTVSDHLAHLLRERVGVPEEKFFVGSDVGYVGGGSMPARELQTVVVQWRPAKATVDEMMRMLREAEVPVVARVRSDAICFDLRTVRESDLESLVASVSSAVWDRESSTEKSE